MFRIGSQPPPQPATQIGSTTTQGRSGTADQLQALMAAMDRAIANLGPQFGGAHPAGGDSLELPRHVGGAQGYGVGMPGGTIGTNSFGIAPGAPATTTADHPLKNRGPKVALAGASIGTEKVAETLPRSHFDKRHPHGTHMRPWGGQTTGGVPKSGMAGVSVGTEKSVHSQPGTSTRPSHHLHLGNQSALDPTHRQPTPSAMAGVSVGTKTPEAATARAAPATTAFTSDPELAKLLGTLSGKGLDVADQLKPVVGQGTQTAEFMSCRGAGGLAGAIVGTKG